MNSPLGRGALSGGTAETLAAAPSPGRTSDAALAGTLGGSLLVGGPMHHARHQCDPLHNLYRAMSPCHRACYHCRPRRGACARMSPSASASVAPALPTAPQISVGRPATQALASGALGDARHRLSGCARPSAQLKRARQ